MNLKILPSRKMTQNYLSIHYLKNGKSLRDRQRTHQKKKLSRKRLILPNYQKPRQKLHSKQQVEKIEKSQRKNGVLSSKYSQIIHKQKLLMKTVMKRRSLVMEVMMIQIWRKTLIRLMFKNSHVKSVNRQEWSQRQRNRRIKRIEPSRKQREKRKKLIEKLPLLKENADDDGHFGDLKSTNNFSLKT